MSQKSDSLKPSSERLVKGIRRATRRQHSAEEKIRIVLDGLRGEQSTPSCADAKALPKAFIAHGRKGSWRPASVALRAIRRGRRRPARSKICVAKPGS
jgi:hypothetical protein